MRSLYFRAWDEKKKIMLDGDFIEDNHPTYTAGLSYGKLFIANHSDGEWYDCVVMQWTGLYDKNGKQIFEGDIIRIMSEKVRTIFSAPGGFAIEELNSDVGKYGTILCCPIAPLADEQTRGYLDGTMEIIGNIYENPELLGQ